MARRHAFLLPRLLVLSTFGVGASLTACSGDDSSGITSAEFAARFCALYKPCCADAGFPDTGQQTCRFFYGSVPVLDAAAAEQCLKDYEAQSQSATFCDLTQGQTPESCKKAFPQNSGSGGTKKKGETCSGSGSSDCAGDATCDKNIGETQGKCAAFVIVGEGQACIGNRKGNTSAWSGDATNDEIALCDGDAQLYCASDGTCKKQGAVGQPCDGYSGCLDDGYCKNDVCVAKIATGGACPDFQDECNDAAYCSDTTQMCEPRAADGASCQTNSECLSRYCDGGTCAKNPGLGGLALGLVCG